MMVVSRSGLIGVIFISAISLLICCIILFIIGYHIGCITAFIGLWVIFNIVTYQLELRKADLRKRN